MLSILCHAIPYTRPLHSPYHNHARLQADCLVGEKMTVVIGHETNEAFGGLNDASTWTNGDSFNASVMAVSHFKYWQKRVATTSSFSVAGCTDNGRRGGQSFWRQHGQQTSPTWAASSTSTACATACKGAATCVYWLLHSSEGCILKSSKRQARRGQFSFPRPRHMRCRRSNHRGASCRLSGHLCKKEGGSGVPGAKLQNCQGIARRRVCGRVFKGYLVLLLAQQQDKGLHHEGDSTEMQNGFPLYQPRHLHPRSHRCPRMRETGRVLRFPWYPCRQQSQPHWCRSILRWQTVHDGHRVHASMLQTR